MRYPHYNFETEYNTTAGYFYGDKTSYGLHEGIDVNDNGGWDSDLGKPIIAMCDGIVTSVHSHTTRPTFGNHLHYKIVGPWGERWVHHAHCQEIYVQIGDEIKEGQLIARIGKSGTEWAHDHWAVKKQPTGIDAVARNLEELKMWESPIEFVKQYSAIIAQPIAQTDQTIIDLGKYGKMEIQQIRGKLGDLERLELDNKGLMAQLSDLSRQLNKARHLISTSDEAYNNLLKDFVKLQENPSVTFSTAYISPNSLTLKELAILIIKKFKKYLPT